MLCNPCSLFLSFSLPPCSFPSLPHNYSGEGPVASISRTTQCSNPEQVVELQLTPASATTLNYSWSEPDVVNGPTDTVQYEVRVSVCNTQCLVKTLMKAEKQSYLCIWLSRTSACS